jgi:RNA polymerase sigma-70 factor (ECF subfamily)
LAPTLPPAGVLKGEDDAPQERPGWQTGIGDGMMTVGLLALKAGGTRAVSVASPEPATVTATEPALIRRAQGGERQAQAELAEHYWDRLYRWLYHLTRDPHAAEDLTQDTFLKAFAHLNRFQAGTNFAAWLFRIAHNNFANHCRANGTPGRKREALPEEVPAREAGPVDAAASREALQELARAIERVPAEFRAALLLRVEGGLSFREIAHALDLTEETARWRVFKARQKLMSVLTPQLERETS